MLLNSEIENTKEYQRLVKKTPFLKDLILKKSSKDTIERLVYQCEKFGTEYLDDKNYGSRDTKLAKEIHFNRLK